MIEPAPVQREENPMLLQGSRGVMASADFREVVESIPAGSLRGSSGLVGALVAAHHASRNPVRSEEEESIV
jgi:hypothetical protein